MRKMLAALAVLLAATAGSQPAHADDDGMYCVKVVAGTTETGVVKINVCYCYYPPSSMTPPLPEEICPPV